MWFRIKCCFIRSNLYYFFHIKAIAVQAPASAQAAEDEEEYKEEEEEYEDDDNEYEDEDEEEEEVGGRAAPTIAAASLIVPVVGNHIQQRNHVNANFEGSSSHLAILYEPLLGTFSDFVFLYIFVLYKLNVSKSYNCCCCTVSYYTN